MVTYIGRDKSNEALFHLNYVAYMDVHEKIKRNLISLLPEEFLSYISPRIHNLFLNDNRHLCLNIEEVLSHLCEQIIANPHSQYFVYDKSILVDGELSPQLFERLLELWGNFNPSKGIEYNTDKKPNSFYIIKLKYHTYRLFYPQDFLNRRKYIYCLSDINTMDCSVLEFVDSALSNGCLVSQIGFQRTKKFLFITMNGRLISSMCY